VDQLIVALDVDSRARALELAGALRGVVSAFKIGSQLFTAEGPSIVRALVSKGDRVFLDLKFHDIPNTVAGAVAAATRLGVWMVNVHAAGGPAMLRAAREAADKAAADTRAERPLVIAVTVLTSLSGDDLARTGVERSPLEQVERLARLTQDSGLDGVVASPLEIGAVRKACGDRFVIVTPGIRPPGAVKDDQTRTLSPREAIEAGASYLVVGRPITAAEDPRKEAGRFADLTI
jgi:orotidine-5'-phosphate decarboxylase